MQRSILFAAVAALTLAVAGTASASHNGYNGHNGHSNYNGHNSYNGHNGYNGHYRPVVQYSYPQTYCDTSYCAPSYDASYYQPCYDVNYCGFQNNVYIYRGYRCSYVQGRGWYSPQHRAFIRR